MVRAVRLTAFASCSFFAATGCLVRASAPPVGPAEAAPPAAEVRPAFTASLDPEHDPRRWFPFGARGVDSPDGLIDLSSLGDSPAGGRGFVRAQGGHFVDGGGQRIRFFGVSCTATACFPTHETAPRAAAQLARLGVNVVRLHFMDKGAAAIGLLTADRQGIDPAQLDRLDFFIAELAKKGIYVDLNLHVARRYPGLEGEAARRFEMGKLLDRFYPPFIESQQTYARALLTHVNPYTKRAYVDEPAVLCVEMNNENTALPFWAGNLDDLPEPYGTELGRQWNVWLEARYRTTARLAAAWRGDNKAGPPSEVLDNADLAAGTKGWVFESAGVPTRGEVVATETGGRALRFSADKRGGASWHLQFYRAHLPLREGEGYRLSFRVRAPEGIAGPAGPIPPARNLEVAAMLSVPDWRNIGMSRTLPLTSAWRRVELAFRPQGTIDGEGRLNFSLRNVPGVVEIADLSLQRGAASLALADGQTVERGTIPLVRSESGTPAGEDFLRFLADTDRATAQGLAYFIRHDLGLKSMLVDTQASYGGLEGLRRELAVSDFIDMHAYWQHPDFPAGWSILRFQIPNTTQVAAADGGALASLADYRVAGKPFTVSEYNVPAPNDYAGEALPMYAAIAGLQDWDAIYAYTYLDFSPLWNADHLLGFFSLAGNPGALSFLPVAALAFRRGLVAPAPAVVRLELPQPDRALPPRVDGGALAHLWSTAPTAAPAGQPRVATQRMELLPAGAVETRNPSAGCEDGASAANRSRSTDSCFATPESQVRWEPGAPHPTFTVVAPALRMAAGAIAGRTVALGDASLTVGELPRGDASVALVALDGLPLDRSKEMLLVSAARVENTRMAFNAQRTGLTSWGRGPPLAEYVPLTVTLAGAPLRAERLDPAGNSAGEIPVAQDASGHSVLRLDHQASLWFRLRR
ncbi:MAG TPA: cellulase family glycosylhydrolase [Polyangia bacterium]|nr:cellulase family glycosylhydrolase [Polyangia bacterium]